ncbi:hypothetical protein MMC13_007395 [Lambiella insularis]|nr:hypothetical protein [Lambiella insularis]
MSEESQPEPQKRTTTESTPAPSPLVHTDEAAAAIIPNGISLSKQKLSAKEDNGSQNDGRQTLDPIEDPNQKIEDYDWADVEHRYHDKMQECAKDEAALFDEFNDTIKLFESWTAAMTVHENDRSYKRLKTRMTYVERDEERLEKKRQHYSKVVSAFESALALLRSP